MKNLKSSSLEKDELFEELASKARDLGALENRYRFLEDSIKQCEDRANLLESEASRLTRRPRSTAIREETRVVFREHRRILREEARNNGRLRRRPCKRHDPSGSR